MPIRFLSDQSIDDLLSVDRVNLGSTNDSQFLSGDSKLTANGYIMAKAIVNTSETGTAPAALVFGNGSTFGADEMSLITFGNTQVFITNKVKINSTLQLDSVVNAGTDTDKFLVLDSSGNVDFRTGSEVRTDIGAGTGTMSSWTITADNGITHGVTNSAVVDIAGGTNITTSQSSGTVTITNGITNNNQLTNGAGYITSASLPTVNNGTLTMTTSTGLDGGATFTANQSSNSTFAVTLDLTEISLGVGLDSTATGLSLDLSEFVSVIVVLPD